MMMNCAFFVRSCDGKQETVTVGEITEKFGLISSICLGRTYETELSLLSERVYYCDFYYEGTVAL